uniref:Uncharacterized protein n=1 Tax=Nelumbo nucifera TaxID=4432 RepID=A0A822YL45_NELNU|nr:TPA_asm: hypothetical protein HUJ06_012161 [Nelumbo nucifera]
MVEAIASKLPSGSKAVLVFQNRCVKFPHSEIRPGNQHRFPMLKSQ